MAITSINIPVTGKMGYVDAYYPNTVFPVTADGVYSVTPYGWNYDYSGTHYEAKYERFLYFEFGDFPDALKYNRIYDYQVTFAYFRHNRTGYSPSRSEVGNLASFGSADFDPRTLTFNTKPANKGSGVYWYQNTGRETEHADDVWADGISGIYGEPSTTSPASSSLAVSALKRKTIYLKDSGTKSFDAVTRDNRGTGHCWIDVKPRLMNGDLPYVTITYDDEEVIPGEIVFINRMSGQIDQGIPHTITWDVQKDSTVDWSCMAETWEQTSATIYWREQGASTWNEIQIAGNTKEYTFPARTFASDKTYEYYAMANDVSGGSSETSVYTFTTPGSQVTPQNSPTTGYANPRNPVTFEWTYSTGTGTVAGGATTLHWRESGTQTWNDVAAAAGVYSVTIPANTFSTLKEYEWYLSGEDTYGYASSTEIYTFSTSAAQITAIPTEPINSIEDKNEIIHFTWRFVSNDGAPSSRSILQYKLSTSTSWTQVADLGADVTSCDVPAETFEAGAIEWRVIPYNIDGVVGTGTSASFIAYGAPARPTVFTDGVPFLTVMWQAEEQESFQIMVDGESYGPYFGTDKQFMLPSYLEDGEHTVKVRTMGVYGLWSKWGETSVTIQNEAGEDIALEAVSGLDISLSWETEEATSDFLIYRDGTLIGRTNAAEFADRAVLGTYSYTVINRLPDGNYSISNDAAATAMSDQPNIALLSGGSWVAIKYSKQGQKDPEYSDSAETIYNHLAGNRFPSVFRSGFQESSMSFSALFLAQQEEERKAFTAMFGQPVILKMRDGTVFIGILDNWKKSHGKNHWTLYEFTIRRIEWEDYRDDTQ